MPIASHPSPPEQLDPRRQIADGHRFFPTGLAPDRLHLFAVNPGTAVHHAARSLCELLDALAEPIYAVAMSERTLSAREAWLAKYTLDAAQAVAGAIAQSLEAR